MPTCGQKGGKVVVNQQLLPLTGERTVPGVARENYWFFKGLRCA